MIMLLFVGGKSIPLPWVGTGDAASAANDFALYARMALGTENNASSFFALGLSPYISASIMMMFFRIAFKKQKGTLSQEAGRRITVVLAFFIACFQTVSLLMQTTYKPGYDFPLPVLHLMTGAELIFGSACMIFMMEIIKKIGIGGSETLIGTNILRGLTVTLIQGFFAPGVDRTTTAVVFLPAAVFVILMTVLMESAEIRIPVRRISIRNEYAGDDYIAVKLHPVGTLPAMYAVSLISLPLYPLRLIQEDSPSDSLLTALYDAFSIRSVPGLLLFILLLTALTFLLSRMMIDPANIADRLKESGDYLSGVHSGADTERYLKRSIHFAAFCSSAVICLCTALPFAVRLYTGNENALFTTSVTLMMLTGIISRLIEEHKTELRLTRYHSFL